MAKNEYEISGPRPGAHDDPAERQRAIGRM